MSGQFLDLKEVIKRGKKENLNFGLCLAKEKGAAPAFLVHRKHSAKKLFKEAKSQSGSTRGAAGTLTVAERLVTLTCQQGRGTTALARGLRLYFKDNGYSHRILLVGPDGETIDDGSEEAEAGTIPGSPPAGTGDPDRTGQARDKRRDDLRRHLANLETIVAKRFAEGSRERQSILSLIKARRDSLADPKADLDTIQRFARDLAASLPKLAAANTSEARAQDAAKARKTVDPHKTQIKELRKIVADMTGRLTAEEQALEKLAREVKAIDRLHKVVESNLRFFNSDGTIDKEALRSRLVKLDKAVLAAPEDKLPDLAAEQDAINTLLAGPGGGKTSLDDLQHQRRGLMVRFRDRAPAFRELQRDQAVLSQLVARRETMLRNTMDQDLESRRLIILEGLANAKDEGLDSEDIAVMRCELSDLKAEQTRRADRIKTVQLNETMAREQLGKEIAPALKQIRAAMKTAAENEDVSLGRRLAGGTPMIDDKGKLDPKALQGDSVFAKILGLPESQSRTRGALEYLKTWQRFETQVSPTLSDNTLAAGDDLIEASFYDSRERADARIKAAAVLGEEAREILALINDPKAAQELKDRNAEGLVHIIAAIFDPGSHCTGEARAEADRAIRKSLSRAIAETMGPVLKTYEALQAIKRGEPASPEVTKQAQSREPEITPEQQAEENAAQAAEDLGFLLGAIEAGQNRGLDSESDRKEAEEAQVKALMEVFWGTSMAIMPGVGKIANIASETGEGLLKALQDQALTVARDQYFHGNAEVHRDMLEAAFRENTRSFRELVENLLGVARGEKVQINQTIQNKRDSVAGDRLNASD